MFKRILAMTLVLVLVMGLAPVFSVSVAANPPPELFNWVSAAEGWTPTYANTTSATEAPTGANVQASHVQTTAASQSWPYAFAGTNVSGRPNTHGGQFGPNDSQAHRDTVTAFATYGLQWIAMDLGSTRNIRDINFLYSSVSGAAHGNLQDHIFGYEIFVSDNIAQWNNLPQTRTTLGATNALGFIGNQQYPNISAGWTSVRFATGASVSTTLPPANPGGGNNWARLGGELASPVNARYVFILIRVRLLADIQVAFPALIPAGSPGLGSLRGNFSNIQVLGEAAPPSRVPNTN